MLRRTAVNNPPKPEPRFTRAARAFEIYSLSLHSRERTRFVLLLGKRPNHRNPLFADGINATTYEVSAAAREEDTDADN